MIHLHNIYACIFKWVGSGSVIQYFGSKTHQSVLITGYKVEAMHRQPACDVLAEIGSQQTSKQIHLRAGWLGGKMIGQQNSAQLQHFYSTIYIYYTCLNLDPEAGGGAGQVDASQTFCCPDPQVYQRHGTRVSMTYLQSRGIYNMETKNTALGCE